MTAKSYELRERPAPDVVHKWLTANRPFQTLREFERRSRVELSLTKRAAVRLANLVRDSFSTGALPDEESIEREICARANVNVEILGSEWDGNGISTLKVGYVRCLVCGKALLADGVSKSGRKHKAFRLCEGKCWSYARGFTADLARREGIDGNAAFNRLLSQLIWNHHHELNQSNNGQSS